VSQALALLDGAPTPASAPNRAASATLPGLTPREVEILRLVAEGHSDREIGDLLSISHRTVMTHVSNILAKLNLESRTAAAAFARRRGLI
jgi:DNA-binding NarL/FixJ family response regulator